VGFDADRRGLFQGENCLEGGYKGEDRLFNIRRPSLGQGVDKGAADGEEFVSLFQPR